VAARVTTSSRLKLLIAVRVIGSPRKGNGFVALGFHTCSMASVAIQWFLGPDRCRFALIVYANKRAEMGVKCGRGSPVGRMIVNCWLT
jgi:hypothetical protein